jgi:hypothetical protein
MKSSRGVCCVDRIEVVYFKGYICFKFKIEVFFMFPGTIVSRDFYFRGSHFCAEIDKLERGRRDSNYRGQNASHMIISRLRYMAYEGDVL